ncbi:MAG: hypothetical protein Satyrvirus24_17 [Satyrvirus sp.]|uniref:Glycosyl hydrolase family 32 N-terminal domain-containing protein n=1 Tax=Satyrvirus sp. TaxID=2487771 RepID=A0A3G5AIG9_9VIRU|nr:MAG: hypothetical protein Satyrvirus24_17 [Satyrvirus sp.]
MILPFELASIKNTDLIKSYSASYHTYYIKIVNGQLIEVEDGIGVLLNPNKNYLIICFNLDIVQIIPVDDISLGKYLNSEKDVWYCVHRQKWIFDKLVNQVTKCSFCYEYYFHDVTNQCRNCIGTTDNKIKKINLNGKKYLTIPVTDYSEENNMKIYLDNKLIHVCQTCLGNNEPIYWMCINVSDHTTATIVLKYPDNNLKFIESSDEFKCFNNDSLRPQLRYSQPFGWINDPNGLVYYQNKYHLFYQYNPFGVRWNNMYWGHAVSDDLLNWTDLPLALHPKVMCSGMCFSGGGNYDDNGIFVVFTDTNLGERIARSPDGGITWKVENNYPIIPKHRGRDPKIIWYQGSWILIVYVHHGSDCFAFYRSFDLTNWELTGYVPGFYECPEMVELNVDDNPLNTHPLNTQWVLFGCDALYQIGDFDGKIFIPNDDTKHRLHYGKFRAPQCFSRSSRVIQIGWVPISMKNMPFNQIFSLPLELSLKTTPIGIRMHANPIKELNNLRYASQSIKNYITKDAVVFDTTRSSEGQLFDILVDIKPINDISIHFGDNVIHYNSALNKLHFNSPSGIDDIFCCPNDTLNLRVIVDKPMYEVCINFGLIYVTLERINPGKDIDSIKLNPFNDELLINEFTVYKMKPITVTRRT